jgi:ATP-dependent RNA helicase DHX57
VSDDEWPHAFENNVTPLGHHVACIAADVKTAKLLVYGAIFGCSETVATIAACLVCYQP